MSAWEPVRGQLCIWMLRVEESLSSRVSEERRWCVVQGVNGGVFARCPTEADAQRIVDRFEQEFRPWVRP